MWCRMRSLINEPEQLLINRLSSRIQSSIPKASLTKSISKVYKFLSDVDLPKDSKIIVKRYKNKEMLAGLDVKEHNGIRGNYILGDDRALILAGPIKKDELGFWTVEKEIVQKLNQNFNEMWAEGSRMQQEKK